MESKKINQLATELTPALSDLTIIGDPTTGISKKITLSQMANLFTGTVEEYANLAAFPLVGTGDTIYIALDTNILYRWDTTLTSYVELSPNIVTSLVFSDANGFDGTISLVGSTATLTITTALTTGSVPFIGASGALSQDNANLFFDDTNNRLGINTNAPTTALDVFGSGIIGRLNGTSTNNSFLGFASAGTNKWSIGNVQSDHRFRIYNEATTSELFTVLQTGEVGIGVANPLTKVHIDGGATALIANLDANVSVAKSISFRSDNSNRINLEVSGTESGSNAGANFFLRTYTDAGSLLATPITLTRSTGDIRLSAQLIVDSKLYIGTTSAYGFNINSVADNGFYNRGGSTSSDSPFLLENSSGSVIMKVLGNGNVGIGTSTPTEKLDVIGGALAAGNGTIRTGITYSSLGLIGTFTNHDLGIITNGTEKLRITSGGDLGIGTSSIFYASTNRRVLEINGTSSSFLAFKVNNTAKSYLFQNGTDFIITNLAAAGGYFALENNGSERLRIASGGEILIGVTSGAGYTPNANRYLQVGANTGGGQINISGGYTPDAPLNIRDIGNNHISFFYGATKVGSVTTNGSTVSYNTTGSDKELKKNFENWNESELEIIKNINPQKFHLKIQNDSENKTKGFIAQELVNYYPEAYQKQIDGYYYFNPSGMVVYLMKAMKEAALEIEFLHNELKTLKNK